MASKWQLWMPFQIDRFKASPAVRAMHPAARSGYLYLLTFQWQTDDCTIPTDPFTLAEISELGDELWAQHGARILRNFKPIEGTEKLRNEVCFAEWTEAKRIYDKRRVAAEGTNSRSPRTTKTVTATNEHGHREQKDESAPRSADTGTGTYTGTLTKTEKQKTLARSVPPEELAGTLPLANGTNFQVSKADVDRWVGAFPGVNVKQELKKFKAWCEDNPGRKKTARGIKSAVFRWLDKAQNNGGGNGNQGKNQGNRESHDDLAGVKTGSAYFDALLESSSAGG